MLDWYQDSKLAVSFSALPDVRLNYPKNKKDECKKPFILNNEVKVTLWDYEKLEKYEFKILKNYYWDGATIPRIFWRLIGPKTDPKFLIPSLIHDVLCENHHYVNNDRYFATKVFERLLYASGVSSFNRFLMFHCVDNFQKIFAGWSRKENSK